MFATRHHSSHIDFCSRAFCVIYQILELFFPFLSDAQVANQTSELPDSGDIRAPQQWWAHYCYNANMLRAEQMFPLSLLLALKMLSTLILRLYSCSYFEMCSNSVSSPHFSFFFSPNNFISKKKHTGRNENTDGRDK